VKEVISGRRKIKSDPNPTAAGRRAKKGASAWPLHLLLGDLKWPQINISNDEVKVTSRIFWRSKAIIGVILIISFFLEIKMDKNLLPKSMFKKYNLPKVSALMHSILLGHLLTALIIFTYIFLGGSIYSAKAESLGIAQFQYYTLSNAVPMMVASGFFLGLNGLLYYQFFKANKKLIAYTMSAAVLTLQVFIVGIGFSML